MNEPAPTGASVTPLRAILVSPEEAVNGNAELWCGGELVAITVLHHGRLHLRVDPRRDGEPWLLDTGSLVLALQNAFERMTAY